MQVKRPTHRTALAVGAIALLTMCLPRAHAQPIDVAQAWTPTVPRNNGP